MASDRMTNEDIPSNSCPDRCNFYLANKKRHCRFPPSPGQLYCGNHLYLKTQQGQRHVPCPVDPTHTVAESKLQAHIKKCTKFLAMQQAKSQPFFCEDINAGSGDDPDLSKHPQEPSGCHDDGNVCLSFPTTTVDTTEAVAAAASACPPAPCAADETGIRTNPFIKGRAACRAAYAQRLGQDALFGLVERIEAAYLKVCNGSSPPVHVLLPQECEAAMVQNARRPYSDKHGLQQASILGNMLRLGLLPPPPGCSVVELGAGKGYLALMLSDCWGESEQAVADLAREQPQAAGGQAGLGAVVLLDCRGFKNKADRLLRTRNLHRLKLDIKDFKAEACPGLTAPQPSSKAIRGSNKTCTRQPGHSEPDASYTPEGGMAAGLGQDPTFPAASLPTERAAAAAASSLPTESAATASPPTESAAASSATPVDGPPWLCIGKHLCGAATDYALRACLRSARSRQHGAEEGEAGTGGQDPLGHESGRASCSSLFGLAIAPCCHHRCGWRPYVGKPLFSSLGFSSTEFELMSWMTGWALCGHAGGRRAEGAERDRPEEEEQEEEEEGSDVDAAGAEGRRKRVRTSTQADPGGCMEESRAAGSVANAVASEAVAGGDAAYVHIEGLPRDRKMAVGLMCKQLIDQGRLQWLRDGRTCRHAELVSYCLPEVSGECRLLVAKSS